MTHSTKTHKAAQSGNVLFIILIAVVLFAALSAVVMRDSGDQASSVSADKLALELQSQAQTIRSAALECEMVNNYGYPPMPPIGTGLVKDMQCQLDDTPTYQMMFTGTANRFLPPVPNGFDEWRYDNAQSDPNAISFYITALNPNNAIAANAMEMLRSKYTTDEAAITNTLGAEISLRIYLVKP